MLVFGYVPGTGGKLPADEPAIVRPPGERQAISETCGPSRSALIGEAAAIIAPYFDHAGDARQAAGAFPAIAEFGRFLRGPIGDDSLDGLTREAEATAALIAGILEGLFSDFQGAQQVGQLSDQPSQR